MGPVRGGLIFLASPAAAAARACEELRPGWTPGTAATGWDELVYLATSTPALALFAATAIVLRARSQWGGLVVVALWAVLVSWIAFRDRDELQELARAEGCIGSPALFIALVAAICVGTILYTAPRRPRD